MLSGTNGRIYLRQAKNVDKIHHRPASLERVRKGLPLRPKLPDLIAESHFRYVRHRLTADTFGFAYAKTTARCVGKYSQWCMVFHSGSGETLDSTRASYKPADLGVRSDAQFHLPNGWQVSLLVRHAARSSQVITDSLQLWHGACIVPLTA